MTSPSTTTAAVTMVRVFRAATFLVLVGGLFLVYINYLSLWEAMPRTSLALPLSTPSFSLGVIKHVRGSQRDDTVGINDDVEEEGGDTDDDDDDISTTDADVDVVDVIDPVLDAKRGTERAAVVQDNTGCPSVLSALRQGSWAQSFNSTQRQHMMRLYSQILKERENDQPPFHLQRNDSACRNVPFPEPYEQWRASCNPDGPTPCCYDNVCTSKTLAECTCQTCEDMRRLILAEHATWRPADKRCSLEPLAVTEVCELLDGRTVLVVGDSLMRHFYIALLMVARDDEEYGAFPPDVTEDIQKSCHGKSMFLTGYCAGEIDYDAPLCNGRAKAKYLSFYHPTKGISPRSMTNEVISELKQSNSIAVFGIGSHYYLDSAQTINDTVVPLLRGLSAAQVPVQHRVLWTSIHAKKNFRLLGSEQRYKDRILRFNADVENVLRSWDVPVFDSFNMTAGLVVGIDQNHYGIGVQKAKINALFHYLLELRSQGLW